MKIIQRIASALFTVIALTACVLITELVLRHVSPQYFCNTVRQFKYDDELGMIARNNLNFSLLTDHIIEVVTNDIGSRNFSGKEDLLRYKRIIFCVGDSYTEGIGNMSDQSYPFYLDLLLNERQGIYQKNYAVFNLGLGAYGSIQSDLLVRRYEKLISRKPDVIVYFVCDNDFDDDIAFKAGLKNDNVIQGNPRFSRWIVRLNEVFENWQLFFRLKAVARKFRNALIHRPARQNSEVWKVVTYEDIGRRLTGLEELNRSCKEQNIKLIVSYTEYDSILYEFMKKYSEMNGILFIDYKPLLVSTVSAMPGLLTYNTHSGGHFRSWINFYFAKQLKEVIEPMFASEK